MTTNLMNEVSANDVSTNDSFTKDASSAPSSKARSFRSLLWTLALIGALADLGSKYAVFALLYNHGEGGSQPIVPGAFELLAQYTGGREQETGVLANLRTLTGDHLPRVNHGALFGMASERGYLANRIFAIVSLLAAGVIIFWSTRPSLTSDLLLCTALGLILGGTLGNLYDRVVFGGVRDFLHWYYAFEWPVFNVADCCLVVGAFLLLAQALFARPVAVEQPQPVGAETASPDAA
jgi:signal peptidase II